PSGSPSPPRAIQNKLLIAISESRKSRRNSVHYPVNAGLACFPLSEAKRTTFGRSELRTWSWLAGFAERALRNIRRSLRLDIGCSDHLAPLAGRIGDEFCEFSGCQLHRLKAQAHKARFNIGFGDDGVDILVELFDNLGGSTLQRTNAPPSAGLVARHELIHGRNLRQHLRARRTGYRES